MNREVHVRFCESVGVRLPHATRLFVERLWRSLKYEEVYLKAYQNGTEARQGIDAYLDFYNRERPHQALGYRTPGEVFNEELPRRCLHEEEVEVPFGIETFPQAAEDSLNLASLLFE